MTSICWPSLLTELAQVITLFRRQPGEQDRLQQAVAECKPAKAV
jgi:hypothetical protein